MSHVSGEHDVVACQPAPHGTDNKQICLLLPRLSSMGAAGDYPVVAVVCMQTAGVTAASSPAALSDHIKCASASLFMQSPDIR